MQTFAITLDIDWAPDFVIDEVADLLVEAGVKATWFVTHASPAVSRLQRHAELFELGIHPNFLSGSTHGDTPESVLAHCMRLVPNARTVRTHGLVQSSPLFATMMRTTPIATDVSLFLPYVEELHPFDYWWGGRCLSRLPFYWEDDMEMERPSPMWDIPDEQLQHRGMKVFNFHPIHVFLNSDSMDNYGELKQNCPQLAAADRGMVTQFVTRGQGTQTLFRRLVCMLKSHQRSYRISDIISEWRATQRANRAA